MKIKHHPFEAIDWKKVKREKAKGAKGKVWSQTIMMGTIRVRMVEYSAGYIADHWCNKGHVIYCLAGKFTSELQDGRKFKVKKGMTYLVGDDSDAHRSSTKKGCRLFIVD